MEQDASAVLSSVCAHPDEETQHYIFQQTMYRIKDPRVSLDFYTRVLGMRLLRKFDFPEMKFSLYFMGFGKVEDIPTSEPERTKWFVFFDIANEKFCAFSNVIFPSGYSNNLLRWN